MLQEYAAAFAEAVAEYQSCAVTKVGRLVVNRELPILHQTKSILDSLQK